MSNMQNDMNTDNAANAYSAVQSQGVDTLDPPAAGNAAETLNEKSPVEYDGCSRADGKERTVRCYYNDGAVCMEQQYKNGKLNGESKVFYADGKLQVHAMFVEDKANGAARTYYPNGTLRSELNYRNDRLDGACCYYTETGQLTRREIYRNGRRCDEENRFN